MMETTQGLICAYSLDGNGGGREIGWKEIRAGQSNQGFLWIHLDRTVAGAQEWVKNDAGIDSLISEALLAEETRPRSLSAAGGLLVILRGVNLNPGAEPEDMVSLRLWIDAQRVITLRFHHLMAVEDVRAEIAAGRAPTTSGDFLATVAARLIDRMAPIVDGLDDDIDTVEEEILESQREESRGRLALLRRRVITLRRYMAPQRDAMTRLATERLVWISDSDRNHLREVADRITRYIEDLDAARDRAAVTQEELASRIAAQMNRTMYVLSLVAAIFLPLGLITGLLGINVGGIPGEKNPIAFWTVVIILLGIAAILVWVFRRKRWF